MSPAHTAALTLVHALLNVLFISIIIGLGAGVVSVLWDERRD
jgi:hypothetical protein